VRRLFSTFLILVGLVLLAAAGWYYFHGWAVQREARAAWERTLPTPVPSPVATPPEQAAAVTPPENPGIEHPVPTEVPKAPPYPYGQPIARLRIPKASVDDVVFGGDDDATLAKGPGHVPGTALPGEGAGRNNCVITGHRDKNFRHLGVLREGDRIELESPSETTSYRVVSREIVNPDAIRVLQPTEEPRLTLITCYPFNYIGHAPHRLVVVAEPVPDSKAQATSR
jgi:LPXTG-site transpeptidase (sortase) family protein